VTELTNAVDFTHERNRELLLGLDQLKGDRDNEAARLKQVLDNKKEHILELKTLLANPLRSGDSEMQSLAHELGLKKLVCDELRSSVNETETTLAHFQKRLSALFERKQKKYFAAITNPAALDGIQKAHAGLRAQLEETLQENESLRAQLRAASASHAHGEAAWASKCQELSRAQSALASIEAVVEAQGLEIANGNV
jgi:chromosome segregation ATPase